MIYEELFTQLAKVGYETMHEDKWEDESEIVKQFWVGIAKNMVSKLWDLYKTDKEQDK